jgi:hypothetical protein
VLPVAAEDSWAAARAIHAALGAEAIGELAPRVDAPRLVAA